MAQEPEVRGTQSFVHTLAWTWRRPSLTALEVTWRWLYGVPACLLVWWQGRNVLLAAAGGTMDPARLGLDPALLQDPVGALSADPLGAAGKFSVALGLLRPGLFRVALWMAPLLLLGWIAASSLGRTAVLRRVDGGLQARVGTLMVLGAIRVGVLCLAFGVWFVLIGQAGKLAVTGPMLRGEEPNLVLYCALLIVTTLTLFTAWGFVSWVLSVAPLLAMLKGQGVRASLLGGLQLGPVRGRLIEINLVMGIVKIALVVLAMVFSATPLPFQSVTTPEFLEAWWAAVTVVYLLWSDFFHVARLVGYLRLWRAFEDGGNAVQ